MISFGNIDSGDKGGGIYLKNGVLDISTILISAASSENKGGFIYTDDLVEITVRDVQFIGMDSQNGGFLYANGNNLIPQLSQSYIMFSGIVSFNNLRAKNGGAFYFNNP